MKVVEGSVNLSGVMAGGNANFRKMVVEKGADLIEVVVGNYANLSNIEIFWAC